MTPDFKIIAEYARKCHDDANCTYDKGQSYMVHVNGVVLVVQHYKSIFVKPEDRDITVAAAYCHDILEDTKQSYNDVSAVIGKDAADIVLAVTDVSAENRLMKHLLTMGKTVINYRAIILKMCDILANAMYSKAHGSSMYKKYVEEYAYRKPIFKKALVWYKSKLNQDILQELWDELDKVHTINN
jgi:(p)ppGpp synthase/HD superfamily hydrolase